MGIREQIIFPEIDYDSIDEVRGLDVTITTTAATDEEAFALLDGLGMPFAPGGPPGPGRRRGRGRGGARKEEARERAEAEAAALEQLKEENPEAYAKPEKPEEGEEGEEGAEGGGEQGRGRRRRRRRGRERLRATIGRRLMAKTSQRVRQRRDPKFKTRGYQPLPPLRPARAPTTASSASAGSACATPRTAATCRA